MKRLCMMIVIIFVMFVQTSCGIFQNDMKDYFGAWERSNDENIALMLECKTLIYEGKSIDIASILGKHYKEENFRANNVFCVVDGVLYGARVKHLWDDDSSYQEKIDIYAIDLVNDQVEIVHTKEYCPKNNGEAFVYAKVYSHENKVIITDNVITTVIDVETRTEVCLDASEFESPIPTFDVKRLDEGNVYKGYIISQNEEYRTIDLEYMASKNEYALALKSLENYSTGKSPTERFFYDHFEIGDKLYFLCDVLEKDGESNALLFSYDYQNESFDFLYHYYTNDVPGDRVYPIFNMKTRDGGVS